MAVGILLLTHENIGTALLNSARLILGELPLVTRDFSVAFTADIDTVRQQVKETCEQLDDGDGVLILSDLYAATPDNIGELCRNKSAIQVISGVNLPMLLKIMNYHQLKLPDLVIKAKVGAINGIQEHQ